MRRSITWSPELWSDSRDEATSHRSSSPIDRLRQQASRPRVSDDAFFLHQVAAGRTPPTTNDAAVAPLVGSQSLGALARRLSRHRLDDDDVTVSPLRASHSLMFDATATHWNEANAAYF